MTSRERLLCTLGGGIPDRVPVSCYELVGYDTHNFCNREPSYRRLMDAIREKTDCVCMWDPASNEILASSAYDPRMEVSVAPMKDGRETKTVLRASGRTLTRRTRVIDGIYTTWETEPLCKDADDVDAVLSLPYEPVSYGTDDIQRIRGEVGDHGIVMTSLGDPAYLAMSLMEFGESMVWAMTETDRFEAAVKELHRRGMENLRRLLEAAPVDMYRICGPEYMCPPYLPPEYFRRFMLPYLGEMTDLIHSFGALVRIHCHGKIARVIDMIADTGCDATDPCEEIPDGDTTLEELKARVGKRLTLFGSMQLKLLENGSTEEVIRETRRMMRTGKPGGRFVLMPTAAPINVPLSKKTEGNYLCYIDTALEEAGYG